ncbi:YceI family protein [Roseivirga sp.]|uniref:YceI family protein n=1 Tax=Roseivirga sp. TaxID=1964215 RepID=UPI003B8C04AD
MLTRISHIILFICLTSIGYGQTDKAEVTFFIKNAGITVDGTFNEISVTQKFNAENLNESRFEVTIPTKSINTGNKARDKHLRKTKYFDVENHPNLSFKSNRITKTSEGYSMRGDLTIKGTKREVQIDFTLDKSTDSWFFIGGLALDRRDYKVGKNHLILGDNVRIEIKLPYASN